MLTVKDIEVNANLTTFCQLCHALNNFAHNFDIQPWQLVSGDKLKNFFLQDKNRYNYSIYFNPCQFPASNDKKY